jgi:predicted glycosyltransferase
MLIWLDILTPKQLLFLSEIGERLEVKGYEVLYTTRQYREVDDLVKMRNLKVVVVGKYGGRTLEEKLAASSHRIEELSHIISRYEPKLSLASSSPDAARTAFGLAIPHYTTNDSPHSIAVARLTICLAEKLFSPIVISKRIWMKLGAKRDQIIQYRGLDPIAWLSNHKPNPKVLSGLGLDASHPIVVFRVEESFAAYLIGKASQQSVTVPIVKELAATHEGKVQIVVLARYPEQVPALRSSLPESVIIPSEAVDGPSLLSFSSLFVGAGGTMTAEASLLGICTLSCYPAEPTIVEKYLISQKLVERICNPKRAVRRIRQILANLDAERMRQREKAKSLTATMEDPADVIVRHIETTFPP